MIFELLFDFRFKANDFQFTSDAFSGIHVTGLPGKCWLIFFSKQLLLSYMTCKFIFHFLRFSMPFSYVIHPFNSSNCGWLVSRSQWWTRVTVGFTWLKVDLKVDFLTKVESKNRVPECDHDFKSFRIMFYSSKISTIWLSCLKFPKINHNA